MNDTTANEDAGEVKSPPTAGGRTWIFQANPKLFFGDEAIKHLSGMTWSVSAHKELITPGDAVYFWKSGPAAGVIGEATVLTSPSLSEQLGDENEFALTKEKFMGPQLRVRLRIDGVFAPPLSRDALRADVRLADLSILKYAQGTNFAVSPEEGAVIRELLEMHREGEDEIPGGAGPVASAGPHDGSRVWTYAPGPGPNSGRSSTGKRSWPSAGMSLATFASIQTTTLWRTSSSGSTDLRATPLMIPVPAITSSM
jgi:hypothetical protein